MRLFFTSLLLLLITQVCFAQKEETKKDTETVFKRGSIKFSGSYISPEVKLGNVHEDNGLFAGGKMGVSFNNQFSLGIGFFGLINNSDLIAERPSDWSGFDPTQELASIKFIYGGLALEYSFFSNKVVHFNIPVVVGPGKVSLKGEKDIFLERLEKSSVFVIEPGLALEFNLFRFFKVDVGASYRYVNGSTLESLDDKDLSDLSYNLTLKFAFFKR